MGKENTNLIISVESRKGGVGKTTAVLCMARLLKKYGYAVLVLDLDITGTNAAYAANSPFWAEDIHVVSESASEKSEPLSINLVEMFENQFMNGQGVKQLKVQESNGEHLSINLSKINIIGSQIFITNINNYKDKHSHKPELCIEHPSVLFDDLHGYWFLELVKDISLNFAHEANKNSCYNTVVICDSSPGYVGLTPLLHDWLTDRGPASSKILTVTSLDQQDLLACERAVDSLHKLYSDKWFTSRLFHKAKESSKHIPVPKDQESFFMRLVTSDMGQDLSFYNSNDLDSVQEGYNGDTYCINPTRYLGAIINRVPKAVKKGYLSYDLPEDIVQKDSPFQRLICQRNNYRIDCEQMIAYDEYIENQFQFQSLQRNLNNYEHHIPHLLNDLELAEKQLKFEMDKNSDISYLVDFGQEKYADYRSQLIRVSELVNNAISSVENAGLEHLSRLIETEWLPGSILPSFKSALWKLLRESKKPYFDVLHAEFDNNSFSSDANGSVRDISQHVLKELQHFSLHDIEKSDSKTVQLFVGMIASLSSLSLSNYLWNAPFRDAIDGLFAAVVAIEIRHWTKKNNSLTKKLTLHQFLAQDSVSPFEMEKGQFEERIFFRHSIGKEGLSSFTNFYKACTSAQARLIDVHSDAKFILQLLRTIVKGEMEKDSLFPYVRDIAEDVIVNKTVTHYEAPRKLVKIERTAAYFNDFDKVLNEVLRNWGVVHA